jgi:hypothetical protein
MNQARLNATSAFLKAHPGAIPPVPKALVDFATDQLKSYDKPAAFMALLLLSDRDAKKKNLGFRLLKRMCGAISPNPLTRQEADIAAALVKQVVKSKGTTVARVFHNLIEKYPLLGAL